MPLAKCLLYHMQSSSCKKKWISLGRYLSRWSESVFLNHHFWSACSHSVVTANGSPYTHRHPLFTLLDFIITTLLMHQDFVAFGYMTQRTLPKLSQPITKILPLIGHKGVHFFTDLLDLNFPFTISNACNFQCNHVWRDQNVETTFYYLMLTEEYLKPQKEREFISSRIIMMMIWALKSFFAFLPKIEWLRERRTQKLNGSVTTTLSSWKVYKWRWSLHRKKMKMMGGRAPLFLHYILFFCNNIFRQKRVV